MATQLGYRDMTKNMAKKDKDDDSENGDKNGDKDAKGMAAEILKSRSIMISEEISEKLAKSVYAQLIVLNQRSATEAITIYINSPGGDADSGFGIYDMLRYVKAPVITVVSGLCASAAVTIFLAADKGKNYSLPNSRFLLHQPSTGVRGSASDVEITAAEINKTRERYNAVVAEITGKSPADLAQDADRDFWMSPEEAVAYKLVSKIISSQEEAV